MIHLLTLWVKNYTLTNFVGKKDTLTLTLWVKNDTLLTLWVKNYTLTNLVGKKLFSY